MPCGPQCKNFNGERDRFEVTNSHTTPHLTLTCSSLQSKIRCPRETLCSRVNRTECRLGAQARVLSDKDSILWPGKSAPDPPKDTSLPTFSLCYLHRYLPSSDRLTSSSAMDSLRLLLTSVQPYLKQNPRGLTSSQCWGRTGTCRCVQIVVAPGQTPGPTASGQWVGSSAEHSSEPAGEEGVRGGWVKGPEALCVVHFPSPPGLPLLHSETG